MAQVCQTIRVRHRGGSSGFGAMQICIHKRAKEIVLFGFDYDQWPKWAEQFEVFSRYFTDPLASAFWAQIRYPRSDCFQKVTGWRLGPRACGRKCRVELRVRPRSDYHLRDRVQCGCDLPRHRDSGQERQ